MSTTHQSVRMWHDPVGFQQATSERYGEPFTLRMHPVGPPWSYRTQSRFTAS